MLNDDMTMAVTVGEEHFEPSAALQAVAERLIDTTGELGMLRDLRIGYCLQLGVLPKAQPGRYPGMDTIAKALKAPAVWRSIADLDAVVWANGAAWDALGERQREAVVLHQLLHLDYDEETGKVRIVKHDVEEFGLVARRYGPWHGGLAAMAQQLRLFAGEAEL